MKKNITESKSPKQCSVRKSQQQVLTIGVDLGDRTSRYCVLDREGKVLLERSIATSKKGLAQAFASMGASRIAIEIGTHSRNGRSGLTSIRALTQQPCRFLTERNLAMPHNALSLSLQEYIR